MLGRYWASWLAVLISLSVGVRAEAQTAPAGKAAAEALFDRGLELMREGKVAEACTQLEQSQAIETGIGTMMYLAECYERLGRTASAWALFREAASAARAEGQEDRALKGKARADALEPQLSKISVSVPADNKLPGLTVSLNGVNLVSGAWGVPVPVDPGESRVQARAPGHQEWASVQNVAPSGSVNVTVPLLSRDVSASAVAEAAAPAPQPEAPLAAASAAPVDRDGGGGGWSTQRTVGIVVGASGIVALGVGTYFGVRALSKDSQADDLCDANPPGCESSEGVALANQANTAATWSNVFVFGGAALLVTGTVLYLTAPSEQAPTLALQGDASGGRVIFRGKF
ncbi:MAG TPA: hypothetical protein VJV78_40770 [Polyangiales bacterium]|nr:hypothetical protein [Polyangiales bacterium]